MFFPMKADIYFSSEAQSLLGAMEKTWELDKTAACELKSGAFNSEMRYALGSFDEFFTLPTILYGMFQADILVGTDTIPRPLTELLVTNIRSSDNCGGTETVLFQEPYNGVMVPAVYEIKSFSPFIDPFGHIGHYKVQLMRADNQRGFYDHTV